MDIDSLTVARQSQGVGVCVTWVIKGFELTYWRHNILLKLVKSPPHLLDLAGAACNKAPGLPQFHFMVSNSESGQPLLKYVDCFWTVHFLNESFLYKIKRKDTDFTCTNFTAMSLIQELEHERIATTIIFLCNNLLTFVVTDTRLLLKCIIR